MTFEEKITALNGLAQVWYSTAQANTLHAAIFREQGFGKFADKCKEEATEEFEEAEKTSARIIALGGEVVFGSVNQPMFSEPVALLEDWYNNFTTAIADLNKLANEFNDDYLTRAMLEEFIKGEEEHYEWVKMHLALIEKIGYENYLIEMMDI